MAHDADDADDAEDAMAVVNIGERFIVVIVAAHAWTYRSRYCIGS
jgi:hypothetical protein